MLSRVSASAGNAASTARCRRRSNASSLAAVPGAVGSSTCTVSVWSMGSSIGSSGTRTWPSKRARSRTFIPILYRVTDPKPHDPPVGGHHTAARQNRRAARQTASDARGPARNAARVALRTALGSIRPAPVPPHPFAWRAERFTDPPHTSRTWTGSPRRASRISAALPWLAAISSICELPRRASNSPAGTSAYVTRSGPTGRCLHTT